MSPTVTVAPMPISTTQLLYESKKANGQKLLRVKALLGEIRIRICRVTPQTTGRQKLHSEARAVQLLTVRVYLPC